MPELAGLLNDERLEQSETVANSLMNRERGCSGPNSYAKDLGLDPLAFLRSHLQSHEQVRWLDLCCGRGRALIQAAQQLAPEAGGRLELVGVDLIPMFDPYPPALPLRLVEASVATWEPGTEFDL